jgi:hypothetical protein
MAKMPERNLLTIGAIFVIIVASVLLYVPLNLLTAWWMVFATMIVLFGCWLIALAGMQQSSPEKYGRGAFSFFGWGLLVAAVGGAWFVYTYNWVYSLAMILLVLGALAIAAAFRRK